jgi:hypothetical protein
MPESYDWIEHTTSESAAQGVEGAWLARLGFLSFGLAVLWLSTGIKQTWARGARGVRGIDVKGKRMRV